jgi:Tfp pilus assembly protein PilF
VAYEKSGRKKEAAESYQRALAAEPGNATAKQGLGRVQGGVASLLGRG